MVPCSLVLLCDSGVDPAPALAALTPLEALFVEVLLSAPRADALLALRLRVVAHRMTGAGAVAGLHAALLVARADTVLAVAVDPSPRLDLLQRLVEHDSAARALVLPASPPRLWPGRYRRGCLKALRRGRVEPARLLRELHAAIL
jgi:molybdopterin-guanine dinucleotide biosynthesis protein A